MHSPLNLYSVSLTGRSGESYTFSIWPRSTTFSPKGGVYAMARHVEGERYIVVFVAETADLSKRPFNRERLPCFNEQRVSHIFCLDERDPKRRAAIVADLVQALQPICNPV
jgi:hypothetical protein